MNHPIRTALSLLALVLALSTLVVPAAAQSAQDSVELISYPGGGAYRCCFSFVVHNRQRATSTISEFRLRIVSGRATIVPGTASSPNDWTVFTATDQKSISWFATSQDSEIDSGTSRSGFAVCLADTGIVQLVWETGGLDTTFTVGALEAPCRGVDCDEAFFRRVASSEVCLYEVDLVGGNRRGLPVNDFRLKMLTPGVTFSSATQPVPSGWLRSRISADSIQFFTTSQSVDFGEFVRGFRFQALNATDTFRVLYRTFNNGELLCSDTATLVCGLLEHTDTVDVRSAPGCCSDLHLSNTHAPGTPLDRFSIRVLTPGVRISGAPTGSTGWTRGTMPTAADSVLFTRATPLASGDTALFSGLCFDNAAAASDTIRYAWTTYGGGIPIARGTVMTMCVRPLTRCDSARIVVDSTEGAPQRCVSLFVVNRNSRQEIVNRVVARIANPGTARRILTASAPPGWQATTVTLDSVVFTGGELFDGDEARFDFCVSTGDTTMLDPVTISWRTASAAMALCSGTIDVNLRIVRTSDAASLTEIPSQNPEYCCYAITFHNRNDGARPLGGFLLEVVNANVLFGEATAADGWDVVSSGFPSPQVGFSGGMVAPGDSTPRFTFCIDARNLPTRPATIPITWRSFSGTDIVTTQTVDLTCVGNGTVTECDTALLLTATPGDAVCRYAFGIANRHTPETPIDRVEFVITSAAGRFRQATTSGEAAGWTQVTVRDDSVVFRGGSIDARDTTASFEFDVDLGAATEATFEVSTFFGELLACRSIVTAACGPAGVPIPMAPAGFELGEATPNPFSGWTTIPYVLRRQADVTIVVRDDNGRTVRSIDEGSQGAGKHSVFIDSDGLAAGVYLYTLEAGGERWTKRMVIVR